MMPPPHPIAAVTHPDPYPYYADLVGRRPLYRDEALGLWVASGAAAVTAVLTEEACRVRPAAEPVPRAIAGAQAGEIFGRLVRQADGERHRALKPAVAAALHGLDARRVAEESRTWAHELGGAAYEDFAFRLPVHVVASLLGVRRDTLGEVAVRVGALVGGFAPGATAEAIEHGHAAAGRLVDLFRSLLAPGSSPGLLGALSREAASCVELDIVANGIGLLSQAYEATAALIGNTVVALGRDGRIRERATADPGVLGAVVREVARHDAPVQNTRRFLARDALVAGQSMKAGEAILAVLAAANRDPAANPDPARFDLSRADPRVFTFGVGPHACAGEAVACAIATAGVAELLRRGIDPGSLASGVAYRPSANVRLPLFPGRKP
jgi:cytochrome P450